MSGCEVELEGRVRHKSMSHRVIHEEVTDLSRGARS